MMTTTIMKIEDVVKQYGSQFTLGPISTSLNKGDTVALMGKNGSGKTTLFHIITASKDATSGKVYFLDKVFVPESYELKRSLGYLPQNLSLPKWVSAQEILTYAAKLYNIENLNAKITAVMEYWDSLWYKNTPLAACSHGMQKRVGLAVATLHNPEFLILDEPFSGLDLYHIKNLIDHINQRSKEGKTTLVCTHIAPYAAKLCNRALIMEQGHLTELEDWKTLPYLDRVTELENKFFNS